jgi:hypothetical protein
MSINLIMLAAMLQTYYPLPDFYHLQENRLNWDLHENMRELERRVEDTRTCVASEFTTSRVTDDFSPEMQAFYRSNALEACLGFYAYQHSAESAESYVADWIDIRTPRDPMSAEQLETYNGLARDFDALRPMALRWLANSGLANCYDVNSRLINSGRHGPIAELAYNCGGYYRMGSEACEAVPAYCE